MFTSDVQLTEFFNYRGDLSMWLDRLEQMLTKQEPLLYDENALEM